MNRWNISLACGCSPSSDSCASGVSSVEGRGVMVVEVGGGPDGPFRPFHDLRCQRGFSPRIRNLSTRDSRLPLLYTRVHNAFAGIVLPGGQRPQT